VLSTESFYGSLVDCGVAFFAGVPDSLLKDFCAYVTDHAPTGRHIITANEGSAVALAMGHHLATGGVGLVYMQNSGIGNAVNPLTSLTDPAIYGIPMILVVGWRGEPGKKDEPQHVQMGRVTLATLEAIGVDHAVVPDDEAEALALVAQTVAGAREKKTAQALVVRKGTFSPYKLSKSGAQQAYPLSREQAIAGLVEQLPANAIVVSTTGKPSRELYEIREQRGQVHDSDLLTVGGMGHASQIALGIALERPDRPVYCLDGDGAALMHMGGLAIIGAMAPPNYRHVVVNNGAHDSVGGQPTVAFDVDLCGVARACGYLHAQQLSRPADLPSAVETLNQQRGPALLELRVSKGSRADLGRPKMSPADLKEVFMRFVRAER